MPFILAIKALVISVAVIVGVGAGYIGKKLKDDHVLKKHLQDDNIVEEAMEKVIEGQTGLDIDLTPSSPEKNKEQAPSSPEKESKKGE